MYGIAVVVFLLEVDNFYTMTILEVFLRKVIYVVVQAPGWETDVVITHIPLEKSVDVAPKCPVKLN